MNVITSELVLGVIYTVSYRALSHPMLPCVISVSHPVMLPDCLSDCLWTQGRGGGGGKRWPCAGLMLAQRRSNVLCLPSFWPGVWPSGFDTVCQLLFMYPLKTWVRNEPALSTHWHAEPEWGRCCTGLASMAQSTMDTYVQTLVQRGSKIGYMSPVCRVFQKRMFFQACEFPAAVHTIENGQPSWSVMERPHSGGTFYVITVSPIPGKYAWLPWRSSALAERVQTKYGSSRQPLYLLINTINHCQLHYSVCRPLFVRIRLQSCKHLRKAKT